MLKYLLGIKEDDAIKRNVLDNLYGYVNSSIDESAGYEYIRVYHSSNVRSVSYNPYKQDLVVEFKDGSIYKYYRIPEYVYEEFLIRNERGHSIGELVWSELRDKDKYYRQLA